MAVRGSKKQKTPATPAIRRTSPRYTDEQEIAAATIIVRAGGLTEKAMAMARELLGANVAMGTLALWRRKHEAAIMALPESVSLLKPTTGEIVTTTLSAVNDKLNSIKGKLLDHLDSDVTIGETSGRDAAVMLGIVIDKQQALAGFSPLIDMRIRELMRACQDHDIDIATLLQDATTHINSLPAKRIINTIDTHSVSTVDNPNSISEQVNE